MNWLRKFMYGRYGVDALSMTLIVVGFILSLFSRGFKLASSIYLILFILAYIRVFSKNINKRYMENQKFLKAVKPITDMVNKLKRKTKNKKNYKYFKCKNCRQKIRVPRGKGKIKVKCPKCGEETIIKS